METHLEGSAVKLSRSKRGVLGIGLLLLIALFVIRPGADRLRWRIVKSISLALGCPVQVGYVSLRFLPPGFELDHFAVHDDPAFSAEPMVRSDEVVANLRVLSLLRGRLEISRLELTEPSFNLVRNSQGHWNVESILERAAQTPVAPTSKSKAESRPAFPYIEADKGRINFKFGQEKKPYSLTEADFSVWQESDNSWGMRAKARPVRTDFNVTDTGILLVSGTWQRAASLSQTPLQFAMEWDQGQLGQLSKLVSGNDKGWRGTLVLDVNLSGTPAEMQFTTTALVTDFRRYDLVSGTALRLQARCSGKSSTVDRSISAIECSAPVGTGSVTARGNVAQVAHAPEYQVAVDLNDVPASSIVGLARRVKANIPDDLNAEGKVSGTFALKRGQDGDQWSGAAEASDIKLASSSDSLPIAIDRIPFTLSDESNTATVKHRQAPAISGPTRLNIGKFDIAVGRDQVLTAQGWVSRTGYNLTLTGEAQFQKLLQVARASGIPVLHPTADGQAEVNLLLSGNWSGFVPPIVTGDAQLRAVRAEVRGVNAPLRITSANVALLADQIRVQNLNAMLGTSSWKGTVEMPRHCAAPEACVVQFDLRTDTVSGEELERILDPRNAKRPWYRFLPISANSKPYLASLQASGKLSANRLDLHNVSASKVSANVALESGKLKLIDVRGNVLGGVHTGEWSADFTAQPPEYRGKGILEHASMEQMAAAMHDGWITGTATADYEIHTSGLDLGQATKEAVGSLRVEVMDGMLPHIELASGNGPLRIHRLSARLKLEDGTFEILEGKLETPGGIFQLSGTASLRQALNVKLVHDANQGYTITGTLPEPKVTPAVAGETRASLKP